MPVTAASLLVWADEADAAAAGLKELHSRVMFQSTQLLLGSAHNHIKEAAKQMRKSAAWMEAHEASHRSRP